MSNNINIMYLIYLISYSTLVFTYLLKVFFTYHISIHVYQYILPNNWYPNIPMILSVIYWELFLILYRLSFTTYVLSMHWTVEWRRDTQKRCQIWFAQPWNMCCSVTLYKTFMVILPISAIYNNIMANAFVLLQSEHIR